MKKLITTILAVVTMTTANAQKKVTIDLNNDGVADKVEVAQDKIFINGKAFEAYFDGTFKSFKIVDINTADDFKEIEITIDGPNLPDHLYYYYNKKKELNACGSIQLEPKILGNGIAYGGSWAGYYAKTQKYVLQKTHTLEAVVTDYDFVNQEYKVAKSFELLTQYDPNSKVIANVAAQSTITIIATYKGNWLMIKTSNGLLGWIKLETAQTSLLNLVMAG